MYTKFICNWFSIVNLCEEPNVVKIRPALNEEQGPPILNLPGENPFIIWIII